MKTSPNKVLFILGPQKDFALQLKLELEHLGISCDIGFENTVGSLRALAKDRPPEEILLLSSLAPGWSFDLLNSLVILFPDSNIFVVGEGYSLNDCACESLSVHCFFKHTQDIELLAKSIAECRQQILNGQHSHVS